MTEILAASQNFWFTVFILIVWGISAYFDFKRKQKIRQQRRAQIGEEEQIEESAEQIQANQFALENAEEQVRDAPYRPAPAGDNLEIGFEDIFNMKKLQEKLKKVEEKAKKKKQQPTPPDLAAHLTKEKPFEGPTRQVFSKKAAKKIKTTSPTMKVFPSGIQSAIIASEILGKPKALRERVRP